MSNSITVPFVIWHKKDGFKRQVKCDCVGSMYSFVTLYEDEYIEWQASYHALRDKLQDEREHRLQHVNSQLKAERERRKAQEEKDEWANAATIQNDEIQACLIELEKAGWNGPASPGIEWLRIEMEISDRERGEYADLWREIFEKLRVTEKLLKQLTRGHNYKDNDGLCDCDACCYLENNKSKNML